MMTDMTELSLRWNIDAPVWAEANAAGNRNAERAELQVMAKPSVPPEKILRNDLNYSKAFMRKIHCTAVFSAR